MSGKNGRGLLDHHRERLEVASALSPEIIAARGYYSIETRSELPMKGFPADLDRFLPGLAVPLFGVRRLDPGERLEPTGLVLRPDTLYEARDGGTRKYLNPAKQRNVLDVHPSMHEFLRDRDVPLVVTEGTIKADAAASVGLLAVSLAGVDSGRRDHADHPDWDRIALKGRQVLIAYDSDVTIKPSVRGALARLVRFLRRSGARSVEVVHFLPGEQGRKVGMDDFFAVHRGSTHPIGLLLEHAVELEDVPDGEEPAPPELPRLLCQSAGGGDLQAAKALIPWLNQALGMPTERVEHRVPTSLEELEQLSTPELEALVARGREQRLQALRVVPEPADTEDWRTTP